MVGMSNVLRAFASAAIGLAIGASPTRAQEQGPPAIAQVDDANGHSLGQVTFRQVAEGVEIQGDLHNVPGDAGMHGIHIHEFGACDPPDFMTAGGHYNPTGQEHGVDNPNGPHMGDIVNLDDPNAGSNVEVTAEGNAHVHSLAMGASVGPGPDTLLDEDGAALVIHGGTDDNVSNPAGNSGARIACGVLAAAAE